MIRWRDKPRSFFIAVGLSLLLAIPIVLFALKSTYDNARAASLDRLARLRSDAIYRVASSTRPVREVLMEVLEEGLNNGYCTDIRVLENRIEVVDHGGSYRIGDSDDVVLIFDLESMMSYYQEPKNFSTGYPLLTGVTNGS